MLAAGDGVGAPTTGRVHLAGGAGNQESDEVLSESVGFWRKSGRGGTELAGSPFPADRVPATLVMVSAELFQPVRCLGWRGICQVECSVEVWASLEFFPLCIL